MWPFSKATKLPKDDMIILDHFDKWDDGCPTCECKSQAPSGHSGSGIDTLIIWKCWACGTEWKSHTIAWSRIHGS